MLFHRQKTKQGYIYAVNLCSNSFKILGNSFHPGSNLRVCFNACKRYMKKANISFLACTSCNNIESAISDKGFSSSSPFLTHLTRSAISIELDVVEDSSGDFLMSSSSKTTPNE
ncbi:hypothetical protein V6Z12_D12G171700 [Gossypium hirsutum]